MTMYVIFENGELLDTAFTSRAKAIEFELNEFELDREEYTELFAELMANNKARVKGGTRITIKELEVQ